MRTRPWVPYRQRSYIVCSICEHFVTTGYEQCPRAAKAMAVKESILVSECRT